VESRSLAIGSEDQMRADLYALLANLLFNPPSQEILDLVCNLDGDQNTEMGQAFDALSVIAGKASLVDIRDEFNGLFIGMGRGELLPYGSYYLTGFLNEKPLATLRNTMRDLGIQKVESVKEPEDHIGRLCEMMSGLILGAYGEPAGLDVQKQFFSDHVGTWAGHFFADLESAKSSRFYQPVGTIGRLFVEIETNAFAMA
jgi:TorA maturation chaperone TorD